MIADSVRSAIVAAPWFEMDQTPSVLLDAELCIRAVNDAASTAVGRPADSLRDRPLFEAFPESPGSASARGSANVLRALEQALAGGRRVWLAYQRYDIPDPHERSRFLPKFWTIVATPVRDNNRVVGVVNHAQEITGTLTGPVPVTAWLADELESSAQRLHDAFPEASEHELLGILAHSHRVVLETVGAPDIGRALDLARLRLEVRTGHPAWPETNGHDGR